jgi:hypothetical protein
MINFVGRQHAQARLPELADVLKTRRYFHSLEPGNTLTINTVKCEDDGAVAAYFSELLL